MERTFITDYGHIKIKGVDLSGVIKFNLRQYLGCHRDGDESEIMQKDIEGYRQILSSSDPQFNSEAFLRLKRLLLNSECKFKNNLEVVEQLKNNYIWRD